MVFGSSYSPAANEEVVSVNEPVLPNMAATDDFLGGNAGEWSLECARLIIGILFFGASSGGLSSKSTAKCEELIELAQHQRSTHINVLKLAYKKYSQQASRTLVASVATRLYLTTCLC